MELTKYQQRLVELIVGDNTLERKTFAFKFEENLDATYKVIGEMVDERGPQFVMDVAAELEELSYSRLRHFRSRESQYQLPRSLVARKEWLDDRYGLKVISLRDAIQETWGVVDQLNFGYKRKRIINGNINIFYKEVDSLKKFIERNTTKREIIVVDVNF
jgi:hypothetical protein